MAVSFINVEKKGTQYRLITQIEYDVNKDELLKQKQTLEEQLALTNKQLEEIDKLEIT